VCVDNNAAAAVRVGNAVARCAEVEDLCLLR
jgi:hypothetical protein